MGRVTPDSDPFSFVERHKSVGRTKDWTSASGRTPASRRSRDVEGGEHVPVVMTKKACHWDQSSQHGPRP